MSLIKAEINALRAELMAQLPLLVQAAVRKELDARDIGTSTVTIDGEWVDEALTTAAKKAPPHRQNQQGGA